MTQTLRFGHVGVTDVLINVAWMTVLPSILCYKHFP